MVEMKGTQQIVEQNMLMCGHSRLVHGLRLICAVKTRDHTGHPIIAWLLDHNHVRCNRVVSCGRSWVDQM